ncbi:MAG: alpha/beta fold hydrolase [Xanthomonadales bacterium]|jgi:pimeloyl-ACP methyl ester carboxylesterase|nr:alpha/beta fold hydrolase [Xanthomonadales bacterium]
MWRPSILLFAFLPAILAWGAPDDRDRLPPDGAPVTRHYASVDALQVHYRQAGPERADSARPVIALHQSPNSSQVFVEFLSVLGKDRRAIAPDTPGFGASDRPPTRPDITDYASTMEGFARALELGAVDVIGYHTGGAIAIEWARQHPERIAHLMLVGVPAFTEEERARFREAPWPAPSPLDAAMLTREWEGSKGWQGPGQSDRSIERTFLAKINAGQTAWWGPDAVFRYPLLERLAEVDQPLTVIRAGDDLWEATERVRSVRPDAAYIDLPEYKFALFEIAPERLANLARSAFDTPPVPAPNASGDTP